MKKAINYAIDRTELARVYGYLGGRPTDQMLPPAVGRDERIYPIGRSRPGDGTQVVRPGEAQAADARLLHEKSPERRGHRRGAASPT